MADNSKFSRIEIELLSYRKVRGYSQKDMADMLDISRASYSEYERGIRTTPDDVIRRFCKLSNIDYNYFIYKTDNMYKSNNSNKAKSDTTVIKDDKPSNHTSITRLFLYPFIILAAFLLWFFFYNISEALGIITPIITVIAIVVYVIIKKRPEKHIVEKNISEDEWICPYCNSANSKNNMKCKDCGEYK